METATSVAVHPSTGAVYVAGDYYLKAAANWQVKHVAVGAVTSSQVALWADLHPICFWMGAFPERAC